MRPMHSRILGAKLVKLAALLVLPLFSALVLAQQKQAATPQHNGAPPQHAAPQAAPQSMQHGPAGGMGAAGGANRGAGGTSNPYGSYANRGGAAGANAAGNKAGTNNPYGAYANKGPNSGANAAGKPGANNPYGSYANRNPNAGANAAGNKAAGNAASNKASNPYGSYAKGNAGTGANAAGNKAGSLANRNAGTGANATRGPNESHAGVTGGRGPSSAGMSKGSAVGDSTRGGGIAGRGVGGPAAGAGGNVRGGNAVGAGKMSAASRPMTTRQITTHSGAKVTASFRGNNLRSVQTKNMKIEHGVRGERRIVSERNGTHFVSTGKGRGYAERAYINRGGRAYYQRTYYYGGRHYAYAYRGYYYGGVRYYGYAPAYYYRPVYYGWAYNPWAAPVYYRWGWAGNPWYGYYNYYYAPYPVYPAASFWLTDYLIAENLRAAYGVVARNSTEGIPGPENQRLSAELWSGDSLVAASLGTGYMGAWYAGAEAAQPQMSKELKDALAAEVKLQLAADQAAADKSRTASNDDALPALDSSFRYFIVSSSLDLETEEGGECALTQGDVVQRTSDTPDNDHRVEVIVQSSKRDDCAVGTNGMLDVNELQEMYNQFRAMLDAGLKSLAENSGKDGLPKAPDTSTTEGEVPPPTADASVDSELQRQEHEADQTEAELKPGSGGQ